jgi:hypothetical protein
MIELLLSCGFDTIEYSWVKGTISICKLVDYFVAKTALPCSSRHHTALPPSTATNKRHGAAHLLPTQEELLPKPMAQASAEPQCRQDIEHRAIMTASLGRVFFGHWLAHCRRHKNCTNFELLSDLAASATDPLSDPPSPPSST